MTSICDAILIYRRSAVEGGSRGAYIYIYIVGFEVSRTLVCVCCTVV